MTPHTGMAILTALRCHYLWSYFVPFIYCKGRTKLSILASPKKCYRLPGAQWVFGTIFGEKTECGDPLYSIPLVWDQSRKTGQKLKTNSLMKYSKALPKQREKDEGSAGYSLTLYRHPRKLLIAKWHCDKIELQLEPVLQPCPHSGQVTFKLCDFEQVPVYSESFLQNLAEGQQWRLPEKLQLTFWNIIFMP